MRASSRTGCCRAARAASRGATLIVNFPGSPRACAEYFDAVAAGAPPRGGAAAPSADGAPVSATAVNARRFVSLVRLEHTVFALPFAYVGAILAVDGCPAARQLVWITLAMVGARSLAMAAEPADRRRDRRPQPAHARREIPAGLLSRGQVVAFCVGALVLFLIAVWQLDPVVRWLWPIPVAAVRALPLHQALHLALPPRAGLLDRPGAAGRLAGRGRRRRAGRRSCSPPRSRCWIGGFDVIYATIDVDFDRQEGLVLAARRGFGIGPALIVTRVCHAGVDRAAGRRRADARPRARLLPRPGGGGRAAGLRERDRPSGRSLARQRRLLQRSTGRSRSSTWPACSSTSWSGEPGGPTASGPGAAVRRPRGAGRRRPGGGRRAGGAADRRQRRGQDHAAADRWPVLMRPTAGTAAVGRPRAADRRRAARGRVGYAATSALVYRGLTARENLELYAAPARRPEDAVGAALDRVGLAARATTASPSSRAACASGCPWPARPCTARRCCCWTSPRPASTTTAGACCDAVLTRRRVTALVATHEPELVRRRRRPVVRLEAGRVVA